MKIREVFSEEEVKESWKATWPNPSPSQVPGALEQL